MKLEVRRTLKASSYTAGDLYVDNKWECYTLEDAVRSGPKVYGQTAIPTGTYEVQITYSNRFKRDLPLLVKVPSFEGVRIHPGNTAADTEGCILVGRALAPGMVTNSRDAFNNLYPKILAAWSRKEPITITLS